MEEGHDGPSTFHHPPIPSNVPHTEWEETDADMFPFGVCLDRVEIGRWKYVATDWKDLELLYELESSDLLIKCSVRGTDGAAPPAIFRVQDMSAADLSLVTVVPGSLESMVARLVVETEEPVIYKVSSDRDSKTTEEKSFSEEAVGKEESDFPGGEEDLSLAAAGDAPGGNGDSTDKERNEDQKNLNARILVVTAPVHEASRLRDILLFVKGGSEEKVTPDSTFLSPKVAPKEKEEIASEEPKGVTPTLSQQITFLEPLPHWVTYIPWWIYSRTFRISIQKVIFLYSFFSVLWALWQLYRHVNIIHDVLEPIIAVMRIHMSAVMEAFDWFFSKFTDFWMRFLSPLNILQGILLTPILQAAMQLKTIFLPLVQFFLPLFSPISKCLTNSQLLLAMKALFIGLYQLVYILGQSVWTMVRLLIKPLYYIWESTLNSRIAVASLDLRGLKISWVTSLVMGNIRAIGYGLTKLLGYHRTKQKQRRAKKHPSMFIHSSSPCPPSVHVAGIRHRRNM